MRSTRSSEETFLALLFISYDNTRDLTRIIEHIDGIQTGATLII